MKGVNFYIPSGIIARNSLVTLETELGVETAALAGLNLVFCHEKNEKMKENIFSY